MADGWRAREGVRRGLQLRGRCARMTRRGKSAAGGHPGATSRKDRIVRQQRLSQSLAANGPAIARGSSWSCHRENPYETARSGGHVIGDTHDGSRRRIDQAGRMYPVFFRHATVKDPSFRDVESAHRLS